MAEQSAAYRNMRKALFDAMNSIPTKHVIEHSVLGKALNIPARYVAFILSKLTRDERNSLPWHRVIPKGGDFGKPESRTDRKVEQVLHLKQEGFVLLKDRYLTFSSEQIWKPNTGHEGTFWADHDYENE